MARQSLRGKTASEQGTVSFDLSRQTRGGPWSQVNHDPVIARNSILGASYQVADPKAALPGTYRYRLTELEENGGQRVVGEAEFDLGYEGGPVKITAINFEGGRLVIRWAGGQPPYRLEASATFGPSADWRTLSLSSPNAKSAELPLTAVQGFFRIREESD